MKKIVAILALGLLVLSAAMVTPAAAGERKKASWGAACPGVVDATPSLPIPKTMNLLFTGNGQDYKLLETDGLENVKEPKSAIGCYVNLGNIEGNQNSPQWQIGALNRDTAGFYFLNAAGIIWRLTLDPTETYFQTNPGSTYYEQGNQFQLTRTFAKPTDCKISDYYMGNMRIGFPRNENRVPAKGKTKNLVIVVDFPDAPFKGNVDAQIKNVLSPETVQNYFRVSSNGKLEVSFEVFPKVIRINSMESSFKPNAQGGFWVNGVQQDHRLVREAVANAGLGTEYADYASISIFAPTATSLGYYGSAFLQFHQPVGSKFVENLFLVNGGIGTIQSKTPSWTVMAHEYGHLLGMYDYYISGNGNTGKSPGPFDFMGNTSGTAFTTFAYQRWVQGWLSDGDTYCDSESTDVQTFELFPLNSTVGKRLYARALSGTAVLAGEFRTEGTFEKLNGESGILLYVIDGEIPSGKGPVTIQIAPKDIPFSFSNDVEKYAAATLKTGEYLEVNSYVYFASEVTTSQATLKVIPASKFPDFLLAQAAPAKPVVTPSPTASPKNPSKPANTRPKLSNSTISCIKGKDLARITGKNPKCPAGWRKK